MSVMCHRVFFFFSSRRRHTRLQGDWSSDVCSSDLVHANVLHWKQEDFDPAPVRSIQAARGRSAGREAQDFEMTRRMLTALVALVGLFIALYLTLYKAGIIGALVCG